jgi:DNA-binding NarL/FixJ family response regulator
MRIVIAEDAAIMRDGLTQTLTRRGHEVVAAVGDAEALRIAVEQHAPDIAIVDVRMPPTHTDEGLRAAMAIRRDFDGVGVLVFSQYVEVQAATELFTSAPSGVGYLLKDRVADVSDFIDALNRVAQGGTVLDPEVVRQLLNAGRRAEPLAALTPREREVLGLLAQGRSNVAIASALFAAGYQIGADREGAGEPLRRGPVRPRPAATRAAGCPARRWASPGGPGSASGDDIQRAPRLDRPADRPSSLSRNREGWGYPARFTQLSALMPSGLRREKAKVFMIMKS